MHLAFSNKKTTYIFWVLRWLLLMLLFYVFGSFLEGPPTRVVVRSMPFALACFALSFLTAQFLHQVHRLPLAMVINPALFIPGAFIYCSQYYYHGGKNADYELVTTFFFVLMCLIGVVYIYSLFVIQPKKAKAESEGAAPEYVGGGYEITLYELDSEGQCSSVKLHEQGEEELPDYIFVDGFSKDTAIDLNKYWDVMLDNDLDDFATDITTYETIIKFGEPMQLVNKYQIVLKLS